MNIQARELLTLAAIGIAVPFVAIALTGDDMPLAWGHAARSSVAAGFIFLGLGVLALFGIPKSAKEPEEDEDEDEDEWRWRHVRLWQLCLGLGFPLLLYADGVTGDTGNFARMQTIVTFWPGVAAVGYVCLVAGWSIWQALYGENIDEPDLTSHGTARFADDKEIKKAGLLEKGGVYLGQYPDLTDEGLWFDGDGHLMTVAASGAGKGVCSVIPNLLTWQGSVICNDPKGACIAARHGICPARHSTRSTGWISTATTWAMTPR